MRLKFLVLSVALLTALGAAASFGAFTFDHANAAHVRQTELSSDLRWIDHSGLRHVTLVQTAGADRGDALAQMFWNGSVDRATVLLGGLPMDAFGAAITDSIGMGAVNLPGTVAEPHQMRRAVVPVAGCRIDASQRLLV